MKLCINGKIVDDENAPLSASDRGFTLGDGVFETMYVNDYEIELFEYHMIRLRGSLSVLDMNICIDNDVMHEHIIDTLKANKLTTGALRITITRGAGARGIAFDRTLRANVFITSSFAERNQPPATLNLSEYTRNDTSPLSSIKTINYIDAVMAMNDARQLGFNDALVLNSKLKVCCALSSNIFLITPTSILTPALKEGCLAGITRSRVIQICKRLDIDICETIISIDDVKNAKSVFLTNSLIKARPVARFLNIDYPIDNPTFKQIYNCL